jgi:hypothetical protein
MRIRTAAAGLVALVTIAPLPGRIAARQEDTKAADVVATARKAIGGKKLDGLRSLSVEAAAQRNVGSFQMSADVELLLEMPDKYMRAETPQGGMVTVGMTTGFNGDRPLKAAAAAGIGPGGAMIIRMGPSGAMAGPTEKPTPEQQQQIDRTVVRSSRQELSRLMLGWFGAAHPSLNARVTYAGEAESPDGKADVIEVKNADGFAARLFIDKETHLPLMVTYQGPQGRVVTMGGPRGGGPGAPGAAQQTRQTTDEERTKLAEDAQRQAEELRKQPPAIVDYTLYFDDWRDVDGIKFPHRLRRAAAGATTEEWSINKVQVNPKIDPRKFETAAAGPAAPATRDERVR